MTKTRAPFPYFGGKSRAASLVWGALGDVDSYVEPFAGSAAVLLARPEWHRRMVETINDQHCFVANFWRALAADPEAVAHWANWPVNETDMHARHKWLVYGDGSDEWRERMDSDPEHYDAKRAGWWVWGLSAWIGDGWCYVKSDRITLSNQRPHLGNLGMGVHSLLRRTELHKTFSELAQRLRHVRVVCGDWARVCGESVLLHPVGGTLAGVFLDPPYAFAAGRAETLYAVDSATVANDVRAWCADHGADPRLRIVLAGYTGEHEELEASGWRCVAWKAKGGYGLQGQNRAREKSKRERLWFSPHCLRGNEMRQAEMFEEVTP